MKRFYFVVSKHGTTAHRMYSETKVEGNLTACGRVVCKGWRRSTHIPKKRQCAQCEAWA